MFNKIELWAGLAPLILSLIITVIIITAFRFLPSKLPLFYSVAWGEGQLATHQQFLIIPAGISLMALVNLVIAWQLHPSQLFFKKILLFSGSMVSLILTITLIKIILLFI